MIIRCSRAARDFDYDAVRAIASPEKPKVPVVHIGTPATNVLSSITKSIKRSRCISQARCRSTTEFRFAACGPLF